MAVYSSDLHIVRFTPPTGIEHSLSIPPMLGGWLYRDQQSGLAQNVQSWKCRSRVVAQNRPRRRLESNLRSKNATSNHEVNILA